LSGLIRLVLVARKSLYEICREFQLLALVLVLPLAFLIITKVTYSRDLLVTHPVWVINDTTNGETLVEYLSAQIYNDGDHIFRISQAVDLPNANSNLTVGKISALLSISEDSSGEGLRITITGDALSPKFYQASTILESAIIEYTRDMAGISHPIEIKEVPLANAGPKNEFDLYSPGMITFGLLMIIPQTAMLVAREDRWKTLNRLRLSRLRSVEILGGISLAQFVIAVIQVILVFLAAIMMGFNSQGSLGLAILIGLAICVSAIGQGLVVACFVQDDSQAANVASTFSMIQVFLSGSFYQLPPITVFSIAGYQIDVFDIFPATHGFRALQQVLTYGDGINEISFRLAATIILSIGYFFLGVLLFKKLKMRE